MHNNFIQIFVHTYTNVRCSYNLNFHVKETRPFPTAPLGEIAWLGLALGLDHFHFCGYKPIKC